MAPRSPGKSPPVDGQHFCRSQTLPQILPSPTAAPSHHHIGSTTPVEAPCSTWGLEDWLSRAAHSFSLLVLTTSNQPFPPHHYILAPNSRKNTPRLDQRTLRLPELHVAHLPQHCPYSVSIHPAPNHPNALSPYPSLQLLQRMPRWIRGLTQAARNQHLTQVEDPLLNHRSFQPEDQRRNSNQVQKKKKITHPTKMNLEIGG